MGEPTSPTTNKNVAFVAFERIQEKEWCAGGQLHKVGESKGYLGGEYWG